MANYLTVVFEYEDGAELPKKLTKAFAGDLKFEDAKIVTASHEDEIKSCDQNFNGYTQPHKILKLMGFNIPQEGVFISTDDYFIHSKMLSLVGKYFDIDKIPDDTFLELKSFAAARAGIEPSPTDDSIEKQKAFVKSVYSVLYSFNK